LKWQQDMFAMTFRQPGEELAAAEIAMPVPADDDVLIQVLACGICRTDLHIIDGDLPRRREGLVPGHEIVGRVVARGSRAGRFAIGARVGVPWLGGACAHCLYCLRSQENLCDAPVFTGYDRDGGFCQYTAANERFCFALPASYDDVQCAPLLCAGLIGYRAYRMAALPPSSRLGLYGFGAAAHIICQIALAEGHEVYAFVRRGDVQSQQFALSLGACWAGDSESTPPCSLEAALIFAPVGELVPHALKATLKAGRVICAGIHMSPIPSFAYSLLWGERNLRSVANLTRKDGEEFFALIEKHPVRTHVQQYPLDRANDAIAALRAGAIDGAAVLVP
jgi:propanol-preferring alcohol dehydrogenase